MDCQVGDNSTVLGLFRWSQVSQTITSNISCGDPTPIRPDVGGTFTPWPLTVLLLLLHLPTVVVRVAMWEKVLSWSLVITAFEAVLVLLAFISSRLAPEKVMVWSTIILVISAGAMLQQVVLLLEKHGGLPGRRAKRNDRTLDPLAYPSSTKEVPPFEILVIIASALLFLCVVALQIRGLVAAIEGRRNDKVLEASWCSPIFNTFSVAVQDSNCRFYEVHQAGRKGIGCIKIPASEQRGWLIGSIALNLIFLFVEAVDATILLMVGPEYRPRKVKMQRPWATMFLGVIVLLAMMACGIMQSRTIPPHITEQVWVFMKVPLQDDMFACGAALTPPGLRGQVISWTDGLFSSWGSAYYGTGP